MDYIEVITQDGKRYNLTGSSSYDWVTKQFDNLCVPTEFNIREYHAIILYHDWVAMKVCSHPTRDAPIEYYRIMRDKLSEAGKPLTGVSDETVSKVLNLASVWRQEVCVAWKVFGITEKKSDGWNFSVDIPINA